jgi:hypothetical protein
MFMTGKGLLVLQDYMNLLEQDSESCVKSEVMDVKVEEVMDREEEEDPV